VTIRNKDAYMRALWDWGFLNNQCFGDTGCQVSDIDGAVERRGHVIFIEAKPPGKKVSRGQMKFFAALSQSGFTVLIVWGETNKPQEAQIWEPHKELAGKKMPATEASIIEIVRRWFVWVNQIPAKGELDRTGKWPITLHLQPEKPEGGV